MVQSADLGLPARDLPSRHVAPGVLSQVVAAHEAPGTHRARELLLPGVCSAVPRQLV